MGHEDGRYEREEDFHNADTGQRWAAVSRFYDTADASLGHYRALVVSGCAGRSVLDYGCGDGEFSVLLAERGARVTGIDISPRRIEEAQQRAAAAGFAGTSDFAVMNAEQLSFAPGSFDLICGTSILHHLSLERAVPELARVLRRDGTATFVEPLGHNALINLYRRLTPSFRTVDEHPLLMRDFEVFDRYFGEVDARFFHLTSLAAVGVRRFKVFPRVVRVLDALDRRLFDRLPLLRRYAWIVVLSLRAPRRSAEAV
ncbi:MAG TPA: class I SAM-dependent methyltransferase [Gaiellaceae bacterium]|nr:class I SAM-dependent methyltransferase [Gaiellaceae bacterium]